MERDAIRYSLRGLEVIDGRARQLDLDQTLQSTYDKYGFIKNAYLQRREYQVTDGAAAPPIEDESLEDPDPDADKK